LKASTSSKFSKTIDLFAN